MNVRFEDKVMFAIMVVLWVAIVFGVGLYAFRDCPPPPAVTGTAWDGYGKPGYIGPHEAARRTNERWRKWRQACGL